MTSTTDYILAFSQDAPLALAGGKGANLAELGHAGLAVPPGFIVTTNAYRAFVEANQIQSRILALAKNISPDDSTALENASAEIRALFDHGILATEIANAIVDAHHQLTNQRTNESANQLAVAIRSSATAEDLPGLAFAGQQDTYLNIVGEQAICDAVIKCWGSLWTARAIAYRARNNIPPDDVTLAVVVQKMIAHSARTRSGIGLSANQFLTDLGRTCDSAER